MAKLLILGTGSMARAHAAAFKEEPDVEIVAAVELNAERLKSFSDEFGIANRFADLESAIAWGGFDSATNVTPDQIHHPTTMKLIAAGKHVLCEKPLATEYKLAKEMVDAAEKRGVINMVNLTYRAAAALSKARELVQAGEIGDLRHIQASYLQSWLVGKQWGDWRTEDRWLWRLSSKHGSKGTVGDIGIHLIDFATFGAASDIASMEARTKTFHKAPGDRIGDYVLDANDSFVMNVELKNGALGVIHATRFATGNANELRLELYGNRGGMRVWTNGGQSSLSLCSGGNVDSQTWRDVECPPVPTVYKRFAEALRTGKNGDPNFRRAADIQRILDLCLEAGENGPGVVNLN